jgi:hypothetical protein
VRCCAVKKLGVAPTVRRPAEQLLGELLPAGLD